MPPLGSSEPFQDACRAAAAVEMEGPCPPLPDGPPLPEPSAAGDSQRADRLPAQRPGRDAARIVSGENLEPPSAAVGVESHFDSIGARLARSSTGSRSSVRVRVPSGIRRGSPSPPRRSPWSCF